jgi:succinate dehydrogenase / fumarate reductase flavoprotein subunit
LDIVVFGRAAGNHIIEHLEGHRYHRALATDSVEQALERLARWERSGDGESVDGLRADLQRAMEQNCGVFRNETVLKEAVKEVSEIAERLQHVRLKDQSKIFNTARLDALELENLVELAQAVVHCALARQESRGAHYRVDYPERDDALWLKHSLYFQGQEQIEYKPVRLKPLTVETFPPRERVY